MANDLRESVEFITMTALLESRRTAPPYAAWFSIHFRHQSIVTDSK